MNINIDSGKIILTIIPPEKYNTGMKEILKEIVNNKKLKGVYITFNKTYTTLKRDLKKDNINVDNLFFIDLISKMVNAETDAKDCLYLDGPSNLTDLSIAIAEVLTKLEELGGRPFLILDSLATLLLYNKSSASKFLHFLTLKLRARDVIGIIFTLQSDTEKQIVSTLRQFVDEVITLD